MRFHVLATDFDGTLAHDGVVLSETLDALKRLRMTKRRAVLVTGRRLDDLRAVFPNLDLFDAIVAENGALLYDTASGAQTLLAASPPPRFVETLKAKGVEPLETGNVIVATQHPHETTILETIREQGLDLTLIFNKGAVMVLPSKINKAFGLEAQLAAYGISWHNVAGIGDAENDIAFLEQCEISASVANALPSVHARCDIVTRGDHGDGVREFIERIIGDDLQSAATLARRHAIALGSKPDGTHLTVSAWCPGILLAGTSGGGKSTLVGGFIERLADAKYQYCIIDPEGECNEIEKCIAIGDAKHEPNLDEVSEAAFENNNVSVSLLAIPVEKRPAFAEHLFLNLAKLRTQYGRPHWLIVDEAHHVLPNPSPAASVPTDFGSILYVTTKPELIAPQALRSIEAVVAVGDDPKAIIDSARQNIGAPNPPVDAPREHIHVGGAAVWLRGNPGEVTRISTIPGKTEHHRHIRKYAEGELGESKSFYFTGPARKLNLRAYNLQLFTQLAQGIDDETWLYHLRRHEYSTWIRDSIRDGELSDAVRDAENNPSLSPLESKRKIIGEVKERYTV